MTCYILEGLELHASLPLIYFVTITVVVAAVVLDGWINPTRGNSLNRRE